MRNRIKTHVRVRAGELVPHELNPRTHSPKQRQALAALLREIGFARSLLAYELPDGRLKLIDGHLRQQLDPNAEVEVEVLDVNDAEARALLLAIDPLAQLAGYDAEVLDHLRGIAEKDSQAVKDLWQSVEAGSRAVTEQLDRIRQADKEPLPDKYLILIDCESEAEQVKLLKKLKRQGIKCQAKIG